jgi:hypothetical protein
VVHTLPPGMAHYVTHVMRRGKKQHHVTVRHEIPAEKIAFRRHLQRKLLPVIPERRIVRSRGNNVDDPLFYHQHIFEKDPDRKANLIKPGTKLVQPWVQPWCCGKPKVHIKKRRHINTLTPENTYISTLQRKKHLPVVPIYRLARRKREKKIHPRRMYIFKHRSSDRHRRRKAAHKRRHRSRSVHQFYKNHRKNQKNKKHNKKRHKKHHQKKQHKKHHKRR